MQAFRTGDRACERAQAWASLDVDGELSQLERALLAAHLRRCAGCTAATAELRALAEAVRGAPPEHPSRSLVVPVKRAARARGVAARLALAATLAALAAGLGVVAGSVGGEDRGPSAPSEADIALLPSPDELLDRRGLRPPLQPTEQPRVPSPTRFGGV
jgi:predicted anti-sigma-YlaC factor YlaD